MTPRQARKNFSYFALPVFSKSNFAYISQQDKKMRSDMIQRLFGISMTVYRIPLSKIKNIRL